MWERGAGEGRGRKRSREGEVRGRAGAIYFTVKSGVQQNGTLGPPGGPSPRGVRRVGLGGRRGRGSSASGWDAAPGPRARPRSQLLRDFECWISHCRVMSMLSFSLQEME